jgi:hypothetical protein
MSNNISSQSLLNVISRQKKNNGADFTIQSVKSGKDYTYSVSRSQFRDKWYTHVSVEVGYMNFKRLGTYYGGKLTHKGIAVTSPSAIAIAFTLDLVEKGKFEWLDSHMNIMHLGNCLCCGRPLTDANSIKLGLGPICASK